MMARPPNWASVTNAKPSCTFSSLEKKSESRRVNSPTIDGEPGSEQAGVREAVASLGTALTPHNARALGRFGVPVIVLYDGDAPGAAAAERAAEALLREGPAGSVALLPEGRDPADLVTEEGERGLELLERTISGASEFFRYLMDRMSERHDLGTVAGRTVCEAILTFTMVEP